ncbi:MAG TPA: hypothetical protein VG737_02355 [Cyclobacteriaceae bacterium]|nr:hypothetical protein [Cyclobacteriaceae bacterium]
MVRRSAWSYLSYGSLFLLSLGKQFSVYTSWKYYWAFIALAALIVLVRIIIKPHYFEVRGSRLIVNRDLFYEDYVEINHIEKFELQESPFSKSRIRLKEHRIGLEFNYYVVNDKDFKRLTQSLRLKVE